MAVNDPNSIENITWHSVDNKNFRMTGLPWYAREKTFNRLPTETKLEFREELLRLGKTPTGAQLAFQSDSKFLYIKAEVDNTIPYEHMPLTATAGFDLYVGPPGKQTFYLVTRWDTKETKYCCHLFDNEDKKSRQFLLNFPLLKEVISLEVGLETGSQISTPAPYDSEGKIVFYGTSITHGLCVARPGLTYANQISRKLNKELVNFGFDGNAKGDISIATALSQISNVSIFILDYEANCSLEDYMGTIPPFIEKLRMTCPKTPILLLSRPPFSTEIHQKKTIKTRLAQSEKQKEFIQKAKSKDPNLYFKAWHKLIGEDFHEFTTDSIHPNSLGATKMAEGLAPIIQTILANKSL